ncbi:MAG: catalase [Pseudobutyrivibrio sp.]|nr:catalase [Pseudobutyrivibrio sp.]
MSNFFGHLKTINHHRHLVMAGCFRVGLYKQGLLHDLSKYNPVEFFVGVKYFQGDRSPNNFERKDKGYSAAWLHHKGRNKHHIEYWIDYGLEEGDAMQGMKMPVKYVVEMYCDRVAACKNYQKDKYTQASAWEYYAKSRGRLLIHPETAALLEDMLLYLKDNGEKATEEYIRKEILHNRR